MTDEIKQDALTEEIKSDGDVKTGKVFSEEEVQKLIRERVQREKDVNKRLVEDATSEKARLRNLFSVNSSQKYPCFFNNPRISQNNTFSQSAILRWFPSTAPSPAVNRTLHSEKRQPPWCDA